MPYTPPIWGIWSDAKSAMLETNFRDIDDATERVWVHFDAGDESVGVISACPTHPSIPAEDCGEH